jgi:hypothetical protein
MSDLELLNGMDQSVPIDDGWILNKIDEIIADSIEQKDAYVALNSCRQLRQISQLTGVALAKLFYLIKKNWEIYEIGDNFSDTVADYAGVSSATVSKYVKVWSMYENKLLPPEVEDEIRQKNIKDQVPISTLVTEDEYELDEDDWQNIVDAPDFNTVNREIRDITGKKQYKNALNIFMSEDGTLNATQHDETEYVGFLNVEGADDIAWKAIQRLIRTAGVLQK